MAKKKVESDESGVYDFELERQFLRYVATENFSLAIGVSPEIFFGAGARAVFDILLTLQAHFPPELLSKIVVSKAHAPVRDLVRDEIQEILDESTVSNRGAAKELLKQLQDLKSRRAIEKATTEAQKLGRMGETDAAFREMRVALGQNLQKVERGDFIGDFRERKQRVTNRMAGKTEHDRLIPTGLLGFDQLCGGIQKGEVGVVIAKSGLGKSAAKLNFATTAWLAGLNVVHVGLEMSKTESQFRLDTLLTQISANTFRQANLTEREMWQWESLIKSHKERKNYFEFVSSDGNLTMKEILGTTEGIEMERGGFDMLILDHILLVAPEAMTGRNSQDMHKLQWDNMRALTAYAKESSSPKAVWTSAHITDEGYKKSQNSEMGVNHIKYGRAIGEMAQFVVALTQSDEDAASEEMTVRIAKARSTKSKVSFQVRPDLDNWVLDKRSIISMGIKLLGEGKARKKK